MVEPGLVPCFEKPCTAKYNVLMSAGLILPEGRAGLCPADSHILSFGERETERGRKRGKKGEEQERVSRRNEDDLCPAVQMQK